MGEAAVEDLVKEIVYSQSDNYKVNGIIIN